MSAWPAAPAPRQRDWQQILDAAANPAGAPEQAQDAAQLGQQPPAVLLRIAAIDLSALPWRPGEATTVQEALQQHFVEQWLAAYQATVDELLQPGDANPLDLATVDELQEEAMRVATARLTRYQQRLRRFLATGPDEGDLAQWLADRAISDAGIWARGDGLEMRRRAQRAYYEVNPQRTQGRWQIVPGSAAEPRCLGVAGNIYGTYDEAQAALDSVTHRNCVHYLEPVAGGGTP